MATTPEYALMAGAAYISTRDPINQIPIPEAQGWLAIPDSHVNLSSGFEAISFQRGTEIVIAFAGTGPGIPDWLNGNIPLALGNSSEQLKQAAAYYMQIQRANPGALITFTGHSLGGGLAALMGVFFNKAALAFDEAPFKNSASLTRRDELYNYLKGLSYTDTELAALTNFTGLTSRENNVVGVTVQGEANSSLWPATAFNTIGGPDILLENGGVGNTSSIDLHSQALLTAFEQDDRFRAVTLKLTNLVKLIFDSKLFYHDPNNKINPERNFIEHLVRHQALDTGPNADMLKHFTNDMQDIVEAAGKAKDPDNHLNKALIAFGLQAYYEQTTGFTQETFESFTGGLRFDRQMIPGTLTALKGYDLYFHAYLQNRFYSDLLSEIESQLPSLQDWFIASNAHAASATADTRAAFMLGDTEVDQFTGSNQNDLIIGDAGTDILEGGQGTDTLYGGTGVDIYKYRPNDGNDTIVDNTTGPDTGDGKGIIVYDPNATAQGLAFGMRQADSSGNYTGPWQSPDNTITYTWPGPGTDLTITTAGGQITVKNFNQYNQDLNIRLIDLPPEPPNDLPPSPARDANDVQRNGTPQNDSFTGLPNTTVNGLTGDDDITGSGRLYGDEDSDLLRVNSNLNSYVDGGTGRDIVIGAGGRDHLLGGPDIDPGVTDDDALQGGDGDDYIEGGFGNDVLAGGNGKDILIGGDGHDILRGAATLTAANRSWSVNWPDPVGAIQFLQFTGNLFDSPDNAGDVMYGGKGLDELLGGQGDDLLYGEADNDSLHGNGGQDALFGGQGIDALEGGNGDDLLFGGSEKDYLFGDGFSSGGGSAGNDYLDGGLGDDELYGGQGNDTLDGGDTIFRDEFVFKCTGRAKGSVKNDFLNRDPDNDDLPGYLLKELPHITTQRLGDLLQGINGRILRPILQPRQRRPADAQLARKRLLRQAFTPPPQITRQSSGQIHASYVSMTICAHVNQARNTDTIHRYPSVQAEDSSPELPKLGTENRSVYRLAA